MGMDTTARGMAELAAFWDEQATADYLPDYQKQGWPSRAHQEARFSGFTEYHDLTGTSVLDVGCGLGDFFGFLGGRYAFYAGIDCSPEMITRCNERYPRLNTAFVVNTIDQVQGQYDYVVSFGIHSINVPDVVQRMRATTRRQFALCRIAAHVSLLGTHTPLAAGTDPRIKAWDVRTLLDLALSITPYVCLRTDYAASDVGLTLYREPPHA